MMKGVRFACDVEHGLHFHDAILTALPLNRDLSLKTRHRTKKQASDPQSNANGREVP